MPYASFGTSRPLGAAVRFGAIALSVALAACSDAATSPDAPVAREVAKPSQVMLKVAAFVKVQVVDTTGKPIPETAWVTIKAVNPTDSLYVLDNSATDLDPAIGTIKVKLTAGKSYSACMRFSRHYRPDAPNSGWPSCSTVNTNSLQVDLGKVYAQVSPQITFITKNQFGTLVGPATFNLAIAEQSWSLTTDDNVSYYDEDPTTGIFTYTVSYPHTVTWCEVSPPPKHKLLSKKCGTLNVDWGKKYVVRLSHEQLLY